MSRRQGGRQVAEDPAEAPGVSSDPAAHWLTLWPPPQAETSNTESAPLTGAKRHLDLDHLSLKSHEALGGGFEVTTERKFRKKKGRVDTKRLRIPNVSFQLSLKPALCALWLGPPYWTWGRLRAPHSPSSNFLSDTNETRPSEANGGQVGAGGPFLCPQPRDQAAPVVRPTGRPAEAQSRVFPGRQPAWHVLGQVASPSPLLCPGLWLPGVGGPLASAPD